MTENDRRLVKVLPIIVFFWIAWAFCFIGGVVDLAVGDWWGILFVLWALFLVALDKGID